MINKKISVVTITLNEQNLLKDTLDSLLCLKTSPKEIVIIDGGSTDGSMNLIKSFQKKMSNIRLVSGKDEGIYDAMNKGRKLVTGQLIHYLNCGDTVYGDPYKGVTSPFLLPVKFRDESGSDCGYDKPKLYGTAYNHQGIVFPKSHPPYNLNYKIAADYLVILQTFPDTLTVLPMSSFGGVVYTLGGISTKKTNLGSLEMSIALIFYRPFYAMFLIPVIAIKMLIPSKVRRLILSYSKK
jgi:hypothetical protein